MNSKETMKAACQRVGVKTVAESLGLSPTAIYNQINDKHKTDILQKFINFTVACEDDKPIRWACEELNGIFIKNPQVQVQDDKKVYDCVPQVLKEFSDVIREIGTAMADGVVSAEEAVKIRKEWEELKALLESFVLASEFGFIKES